MPSLPISVTNQQLLNQYAELFHVSVEDALDKALSNWFKPEGSGRMLIEHKLSQCHSSVLVFPAPAPAPARHAAVSHKHTTIHRRAAAN